MAEQSIQDPFDTRLGGLLRAYGDEAVGRFEAALIADVAITRGLRSISILERLRAVAPTLRLVAVAAVLGLALAVAVLLVGSLPPSDPSHIVYVRSGDVFVTDGQGGHRQLIAAGHADANQAGYLSGDLSPDGSRVAAVLGLSTRLTVDILAVTGGVHGTFSPTTDGLGMQATWSPDGRHVAVVTGPGRDEISDLFVLGPDGGLERTLPWPEGFLSYEPIVSWSPDGRWILVTGCPCSYTSRGLWIVSPDGSTTRQLAESAGAVWKAVWSPDGGRIAFAANGLWLAETDGPARHLVPPSRTENTYIAGLGWSPDGRWIAMTIGDPTSVHETGTETFALVVVSVADGSMRTLVSGTASKTVAWDGRIVDWHVLSGEAMVDGPYGDWPKWTPDSRAILYDSIAVGETDPAVRQISLDGSASTVLIPEIDRGFDAAP